MTSRNGCIPRRFCFGIHPFLDVILPHTCSSRYGRLVACRHDVLRGFFFLQATCSWPEQSRVHLISVVVNSSTLWKEWLSLFLDKLDVYFCNRNFKCFFFKLYHLTEFNMHINGAEKFQRWTGVLKPNSVWRMRKVICHTYTLMNLWTMFSDGLGHISIQRSEK